MTGLWAITLGLSTHARAAEPLEQAMGLIQQNLPEQADPVLMQWAALNGIVEHLNQQLGVQTNQVLTAEDRAQEAAFLRGQSQGIGTEFIIIEGLGLTLDHVFPEGPASRAGLVRGDLIVAINDHPFTGLTDSEIFNRAVAESRKSLVILDVRREDRTRRFEIQRGSYHTPAVSLHPTEHNCIKLRYFGAGSAEALATLLRQLDPSAGLLIDLRETQFGILPEMIAAAGHFLERGSVVTIQRAADGTEEPMSTERAPIWTGPLVLLVDQDTAGMAEAFTMALSEHGARVSGTQTAGIAREPSYYRIDNGLFLKLTDKSLRAPSGRTWEGQGLRPDLWIEPVSNSPSGILPDVQLRIALGLLRDP